MSVTQLIFSSQMSNLSHLDQLKDRTGNITTIIFSAVVVGVVVFVLMGFMTLLHISGHTEWGQFF